MYDIPIWIHLSQRFIQTVFQKRQYFSCSDVYVPQPFRLGPKPSFGHPRRSMRKNVPFVGFRCTTYIFYAFILQRRAKLLRHEPMNTVHGAVICSIRLLSHDSLDDTEPVSSRDLDCSRNGCELGLP